VGGLEQRLDVGRRVEAAITWIRSRLFTGTRRIWFAAAAVCLLTWQISFIAPATGLDFSWMAGLYMAVHQGKDFGQEIVFTYGPLGFLAWPGVWYSLLGLLAFLFSVAVFYAFAALLLAALERSVGLLAAVIVACLFFATIPDLEQVPLMLAVGLCFLALRTDRPSWGLTVLAAGGGTLSAFELLIKLSAGPEIFVACLLAMIGARAGRKDWGIFLGTSIGGTILLWLLAGQSLESLWDYGTTGIHVVTGYNEAMGLSGAKDWTAVLLIVAALGLVLATALAPFRDRRARLSAVLLVSVAVFSSYKYGIVRFEPGHVALALSALVGIWLQLPLPRARAVAFLGATFVRRVHRFKQFTTRPSAGKDPKGRVERLQGRAIPRKALTLRDHGAVPSQPQPAQIFLHGRDKFRSASCPIEIVVTKIKRSAGLPRPSRRFPKRPRMTQVQIARGRRCETSTIGRQRHDEGLS